MGKHDSDRKNYFGIWVILIVAAIIRCSLILMVPITWTGNLGDIQAHNDEPSHINYIRYLMQNHTLPIQVHNIQESDAFLRNEFEYFQPPFQYLVTALLATLCHIHPDSGSLVYFSRSLSMIFGLISIFLFFNLLKNQFNLSTASYITWIYSLLPIHIRHSSSFSNDQMTWIFTMILIFFIIKKIQNDQFKPKYIWLEGMILGISLWTKATMFPMLVFYTMMALIQRNRWKAWSLPILISLILILPYFIRNIILYNELFGIRTSSGSYQIALSSFKPAIWFTFLRGMLISFVFPYDTIKIPFPIRFPAYLVWFAFFLIVAYLIVKNVKKNLLSMTFNLQFSYIMMMMIFFLAMISFNIHYLQTEFRLIFHMIPFLFLFVFQNLSPQSSAIKIFILGAVLYPLILVYIYM